MLIDIFGWIGSAMLAVCAVPEAWHSFKRGHTHMAWSLLILMGGGECFLFVYVVGKIDWPLIANYGINILSMAVILWYKLHPKAKFAK